MISILKDTGIDIRNKYTKEEFYASFTGRHRNYKNWRNQTFIELSGLQVWKDYILYDEPERDRLDAQAAEELTCLIETRRLNRIVCLADVFDALSTKRPYKDPWPLEK